ncbi:MAG TPA: hypothetical protein VLJ86_01390 [Ramlibacter sp.]|nr:hypothetical protein [Ramlibacter sp.]
MHHTQQQLDQLWSALKSSDAALRADVLDRYTNPHMPGVYPSILWDEPDAQKLSLPTPDHPGRHVYVRKPGAQWAQER